MKLQADRAAWLVALRAGADLPPRRPRVPLCLGSEVVGSVEPDFLSPLHGDDDRARLERLAAGWRLNGDPTQALAVLADRLRQAGLAGAWRNEQLAVRNAEGQQVATVERAVVRCLGIQTQAVHLLGVARDGRHWVQLRAFDKPNDPGLWDTLMGGMVSAADSLETALVRETFEEAGLRPDALRGLRPGGEVITRRPSDEAGGYIVEQIDWFVATLPDGVAPVNQDGEVERFELIDEDVLWQRVKAGAFTAEAALIFAAYLGW